MTRVMPSDPNAERSMIGAALLSVEAIDAGLDAGLTSLDFHNPDHGEAWQACVDLWAKGTRPDPLLVAAATGGRSRDLVAMSGDVPSLGNANRYARLIVNQSVKRRLLLSLAPIEDEAFDVTSDAGEVVDAARTVIGSIDMPADGGVPAGLDDVDDILARGVESSAPWVIRGLVRRDWRVLVVAAEGAGKTQLLRQLAICAGQGVHPFTASDSWTSRRGQIDPITTLIVDAENPDDHVKHSCGLVAEPLKRALGAAYVPGQTKVFSRKQGINLRSRSARMELAAVLDHVRPALVVMGPIYKLGTRRLARESPEEAVEEVQEVLDDLRTRYQFGLVLEHHAPKQTGGVREMEPYGSQRWLGWPEIGLGMRAVDGGNEITFDRFRGDRLPNGWPKSVARGVTGPTRLPFHPLALGYGQADPYEAA